VGREKLSDWVSGYSVELALLLAVRAPPLPRLPPLLMLLLCSRRCRSGSLFFLSALALVNSLGVASPHRVFPTVLVLVPRFVGNFSGTLNRTGKLRTNSQQLLLGSVY
jgi:hypothetical protein